MGREGSEGSTVSSKTITAQETVRVTPAPIAAAPTTAYPPAVICKSGGVTKLRSSPKQRPVAAPIKKTGVKTPHEMGQPTAITVKTNLQTYRYVGIRCWEPFGGGVLGSCVGELFWGAVLGSCVGIHPGGSV